MIAPFRRQLLLLICARPQSPPAEITHARARCVEIRFLHCNEVLGVHLGDKKTFNGRINVWVLFE